MERPLLIEGTVAMSDQPHLSSAQNSFGSLLSYRLQSSTSALRVLKPASSFVTINQKRSFRPPPFILHSIVAFFPERVPLSFANVSPAVRLFIESTGGSEERLGYALDGYRVSRASTGAFIAPCDDGGVVEDDAAAAPPPPPGPPASHGEQRSPHGSFSATSSTRTTAATSNGVRASVSVTAPGISDGSMDSPIHIQAYPYLFASPGFGALASRAEQHLYPCVGYRPQRRPLGGRPRAPGRVTAVRAAAAATAARGNAPVDHRGAHAGASVGGGSPSPDSLLADLAVCEARCWQGGLDDLSLCPSLRCTSTAGLGMALFSVWWLSRYYGVSVTLEGLHQREHVATFKEVARLLSVRELVCMHCTLTQEWMQVISSCSELISLSLVACAADADVALMYVDSILTRPCATTSSSPCGSPSKPRPAGLSKWYIGGSLSIGVLRHLRCVHLVHTPVTQAFLDALPGCAENLECVLMHKARGVSSLKPLAALPRLRCVGLQSSSVEDSGAQHLGRCQSLRRLALVECRRITSLDFFAGLGPSLRQLTLSHNWFAEQHMHLIAHCTSLVELQLHSLKRLSAVGPLAVLHNLEVLNVGDTTLTTEGAGAALRGMRLTRVNLSSCLGVTSVSEWLRDHCTTLTSLDLSGSGVSGEGLRGLAQCQVLRYLNLADCSKLTSIAELRGAPALRWLSLAGTPVTGADLAHALGGRHTRTLRYLSLQDCPGVKQLDFLRGLPSLTYLHLENTAVTDASLAEVGACARLAYLNLSRCSAVTDLRALAGLRRLREVDISYTAVTEAGLRPMAACTSIEVLHARSCQHLDGLVALEKLPALKELRVDGFGQKGAEAVLLSSRPSPGPPTARQQSPHLHAEDATGAVAQSRPQSTPSLVSVTSNVSGTSGAPSPPMGTSIVSVPRSLGAASSEQESHEVSTAHAWGADVVHLPTLVEFSARKSALTETGLSSLLCASHFLVRLDIAECRGVRELAGLEHLCGLTELTAAQCTQLSNAGLQPIRALRALRRLSLAGCTALTDLAPLAHLSCLEELDASLTRVTDDGLAGLSECGALQLLSLADCRFVTSVRPLAPLRFLRELHLESTAVTNAGIAALASCVCLQRLYLTKCKQVTDVTEIRGALRQLEVCDVYGTLIPTRIAGEPKPSPCTVL